MYVRSVELEFQQLSAEGEEGFAVDDQLCGITVALKMGDVFCLCLDCAQAEDGSK